MLFLTSNPERQHRAALEAAGARVDTLPPGPQGVDLEAAMRHLARLEVNELQVECGPTLAGALFDARLVDELVLYLAPTLLGADALPLARLAGLRSMADRPELALCDVRRVGRDLRLRLRPVDG